MTMRYPNEYVVYDFETTGKDPATCEIVEIGAVKVRGGEIVDKFSTLVKHVGPMDPQAEAVHGISAEMIERDGRRLDEALMAFEQFVEDLPLVGHNILRFDNVILRRLIEERDRAEGNPPVSPFYEALFYSVDTAVIFKARALGFEQEWHEDHQRFGRRVMEHRSPQKFNLAFAARELGLEEGNATLHRALADVELCEKVYRKLALE